jgi:hypothetical protein
VALVLLTLQKFTRSAILLLLAVENIKQSAFKGITFTGHFQNQVQEFGGENADSMANS